MKYQAQIHKLSDEHLQLVLTEVNERTEAKIVIDWKLIESGDVNLNGTYEDYSEWVPSIRENDGKALMRFFNSIYGDIAGKSFRPEREGFMLEQVSIGAAVDKIRQMLKNCEASND